MVKRIFPCDSSIAISAVAILDQALHLADGLARHDDAGHSVGALRQIEIDLRQAVAVSRDRAQRLRLGGAGEVEIDAVEVVARLLGRDRELGLVDQALEVGGGKVELVGHFAGREIGKIAFRQGLQGKARAAGADRQHGAVAGGFEDDLRAFGQLAHDLEEHVRRDRGRSARPDLGRDRIGHFEVEVGGLEAELGAVGAHVHVGEDRNRVAPLHHAVDVTQRLQQFGPLDGDFHRVTRSISGDSESGVRHRIRQGRMR